MHLRALLEVVPDARVEGPVDLQVGKLECDSRRVQQGDVFVAIRGGQEKDRHLYVGDALQRGAGVLVVEDAVERGRATCVRVHSCRRALARMAARYYEYPARHLLCAGVTGTNGKTTTAFLLRRALAAAGRPCGYIGTLGCVIEEELEKIANTTPEAPELQRLLRQMVAKGRRAVAMEVSSHALALERVGGMDFQVGIFTNLTRDHLDFHGSEEKYFAAKARLFEQVGEGGAAVINADDEAGLRLAGGVAADLWTYGRGEAARVRLRENRPTAEGQLLRLQTPSGEVRLQTHLKGSFNAYNATAALAAGLALGLDAEALCRGIASLESVPGRFERIAEGQDFEVIVDYAHTPDALRTVLETAREFTGERLVCVFGCGGDRDRGKRPQMGRIAGELADEVFVTSDNPRSEDPASILAEIERGLPASSRAHILVDRKEAIRAAIGGAKRGDVVVIAGKGHEPGQILADRVIPFDDREVARSVLRARDGREGG